MNFNSPEVESGGLDEDYATDNPLKMYEADEYEEYDSRPQWHSRRNRIMALVMGMLVILVVALGIYFALDKNGVSVKTEKSLLYRDEGITKEELLLHNTVNDCWQVYYDEVYDTTKYIPCKHIHILILKIALNKKSSPSIYSCTVCTHKLLFYTLPM